MQCMSSGHLRGADGLHELHAVLRGLRRRELRRRRILRVRALRSGPLRGCVGHIGMPRLSCRLVRGDSGPLDGGVHRGVRRGQVLGQRRLELHHLPRGQARCGGRAELHAVLRGQLRPGIGGGQLRPVRGGLVRVRVPVRRARAYQQRRSVRGGRVRGGLLLACGSAELHALPRGYLWRRHGLGQRNVQVFAVLRPIFRLPNELVLLSQLVLPP